MTGARKGIFDPKDGLKKIWINRDQSYFTIDIYLIAS
jgi:hypothetical protein